MTKKTTQSLQELYDHRKTAYALPPEVHEQIKNAKRSKKRHQRWLIWAPSLVSCALVAILIWPTNPTDIESATKPSAEKMTDLILADAEIDSLEIQEEISLASQLSLTEYDPETEQATAASVAPEPVTTANRSTIQAAQESFAAPPVVDKKSTVSKAKMQSKVQFLTWIPSKEQYVDCDGTETKTPGGLNLPKEGWLKLSWTETGSWQVENLDENPCPNIDPPMKQTQ